MGQGCQEILRVTSMHPLGTMNVSANVRPIVVEIFQSEPACWTNHRLHQWMELPPLDIDDRSFSQIC